MLSLYPPTQPLRVLRVGSGGHCPACSFPQKAQAEVEGLGKGVARLSAEAEKVLALPEPSSAAPILRSELELTLGKLEQVRSLSAIYLEK